MSHPTKNLNTKDVDGLEMVTTKRRNVMKPTTPPTQKDIQIINCLKTLLQTLEELNNNKLEDAERKTIH
jgi:hypothetical protein